MVLLFGMMLAFIFMGMELGTAMGLSGMIYILISWLGPAPIPLSIIPQNFVYGVDSFPLLAVPLFMLAGELMDKGGVTERLVRFSRALVGHIRGGLANVSVVANMIMAGMSGSSVADATATGTVLIPAMKKAKYPPEMAAAVIAASATIGPIIPPEHSFCADRQHDRREHRPVVPGRGRPRLRHGGHAPHRHLYHRPQEGDGQRKRFQLEGTSPTARRTLPWPS